MGLRDEIKKAARANGTKIQDSSSAELEKILNRMFYLEKDMNNELKFIKQVMTRGTDTQERIGLHASAIIVSDAKFCVRQQVLSLFYKQAQGENINAGLKRIFEEGNAIHEKWQRLFIRAGYSKPEQCDMSFFNDDYDLSFTPDLGCNIPEFADLGELVGEIKSVNTYQFQKIDEHPSGSKQMQFYMFLRKRKHGFVLMEDKNTQDFKVRLYNYDPYIVEPFIVRLDNIQEAKHNLVHNHKMVARCSGCSAATCKRAMECPMRDACWNVGMGRIPLEKAKNANKS